MARPSNSVWVVRMPVSGDAEVVVAPVEPLCIIDAVKAPAQIICEGLLLQPPLGPTQGRSIHCNSLLSKQGAIVLLQELLQLTLGALVNQGGDSIHAVPPPLDLTRRTVPELAQPVWAPVVRALEDPLPRLTGAYILPGLGHPSVAQHCPLCCGCVSLLLVFLLGLVF